HRLWSQEHRYERSRLAEALNSLTSERFTQTLNDATQVLPEYFAFGAPDDLECRENRRALGRREGIRKRVRWCVWSQVLADRGRRCGHESTVRCKYLGKAADHQVDLANEILETD